MAIYLGHLHPTFGVPVAYKDGTVFSPADSLKLRNHSPDGFNWGYCGSGPAQLALALLLDVLGSAEALRHYQRYKSSVVAGWRGDQKWVTCSQSIIAWWIGEVGWEHEAAVIRGFGRAVDTIGLLADRLEELDFRDPVVSCLIEELRRDLGRE